MPNKGYGNTYPIQNPNSNPNYLPGNNPYNPNNQPLKKRKFPGYGPEGTLSPNDPYNKYPRDESDPTRGYGNTNPLYNPKMVSQSYPVYDPEISYASIPMI